MCLGGCPASWGRGGIPGPVHCLLWKLCASFVNPTPQHGSGTMGFQALFPNPRTLDSFASKASSHHADVPSHPPCVNVLPPPQSFTHLPPLPDSITTILTATRLVFDGSHHFLPSSCGVPVFMNSCDTLLEKAVGAKSSGAPNSHPISLPQVCQTQGRSRTGISFHFLHHRLRLSPTGRRSEAEGVRCQFLCSPRVPIAGSLGPLPPSRKKQAPYKCTVPVGCSG